MKRGRGICLLSLAAAVLLSAGLGSCITGCGNVEPETRVGWDPVRRQIVFRDTKDNDIEIKNLKYDPATDGFSMESLVIRNNASDVMTANVAQMQVILEMHKTFGQNAQIVLGGLADIAGQLTPLLGTLKTTTQQQCALTDLLKGLVENYTAPVKPAE